MFRFHYDCVPISKNEKKSGQRPRKKYPNYENKVLVDINFKVVNVNQYTDQDLIRMWENFDIFRRIDYRHAATRISIYKHPSPLDIASIRKFYAEYQPMPNQIQTPTEIPKSIVGARSLLEKKKTKGTIEFILNDESVEPTKKRRLS